MTEMRAPRRLMLAIACLGALGTGAAALGYRESLHLQSIVLEREEEHAATNSLRVAITEAESAVRGYLLYRQMDYVERFHRAAGQVESASARRILALVDGHATTQNAVPASEIVARALEERRAALRLVADGQIERVLAFAAAGNARRPIDQAQERIGQFIQARQAEVGLLSVRLDRVQLAVLLLIAGSAILAAFGLLLASRLIHRRGLDAEQASRTLSARSAEIGALLRMNEMLQACQSRADVESVVSRSAPLVLPGTPGSLYVFSNSRDRLDRAACWPPEMHAGAKSGAHTGTPGHFSAADCWALKRGRPHACGGEGHGCESSLCGTPALCLPMAARGEVYGVLRFAEQPMAGEDSAHLRQLAEALADAVSMALANLSLREKLRGEALRDQLTGLYNRRFLDEVAPAFLRQAERRQSPVCVAMLDVDHFKAVNDKHGHVMGDTLLRALAGTLSAGLRASDVVCRYGGEEFLLLLPDCDLGGAFERMEELRRQILFMHESSTMDLPRITVSIGLAQVEHGVVSLDKAIRQADEALYAAKQAGRNLVLTAPMMGLLGLPNAITAEPDHPDG